MVIRDPADPRMASHGWGYRAALWLSQGQQVKLGQQALPPDQDRSPQCSSSLTFPTGARPGQGLQSPRHPDPGLGNGLVPITSRILIWVLPVAFCHLYRGVAGQTGGWQPPSLAPVCPLPLWHTWCTTISTHAFICLAFSSEVFSLSWQHWVCSMCQPAAAAQCPRPGLCPASAALLSPHLFLSTASCCLSQSSFGNLFGDLLKNPFKYALWGKIPHQSPSWEYSVSPASRKVVGGNGAPWPPVVPKRKAKQNRVNEFFIFHYDSTATSHSRAQNH